MNINSDQSLMYFETMELLSENMPISFFWLDKDGYLVKCNKHELNILGSSSYDDIIGKHSSVLFSDEAWKNSEKVMLTGIPLIVEEIHYDKINNIKKYFLSCKKPIFDDKNELIGLVGIAIDITEKKEIEQLAIEHKIMEEKLIAQEINNKYVGIMAHELRTPIATFKLYLDLIKANICNKELSAEEKESNILDLASKGEDVEKSTKHFIDMILYKLRSVNNRMDKDSFNLCLIADDVEEVLDTYAFGSGERALITVKKANAFTYKGDSVATKHIVSNLIKNTLKIIKEEDKGKITISFDQSDEKYNKMIFEDDAKGIDEKFLPLIFDSFVYKDSTGKGTGLGLAFCKMIMVDYGGDIICESELGKYTRFTCLFPKVDMSEFDFA